MTQLNPLRWSLTVAAIAVVALPGMAIAQAVPKTLRRGMPYAQARKTLMQDGWQTVQSPDRDRSSTTDYLIHTFGYNEVDSCAGTGAGFCRFNFADAKGQTLAVVTVNNQRGQQPIVYRWWIDKGETP